MPFETAKPIEVGNKSVGAYCRASVRTIRGRNSMKITVNQEFLDAYLPGAKSGDAVNVQYGTGSDAGVILLAPVPSGKVELRKYIKNSFTLSFAAWGPFINTTHKSKDCKVLTGDGKSVAVKLPF